MLAHPVEADADETGPADDRRARERLCVATRQVRPVGALLRLVAAPDGTLTPDLRRRLPGRGVWVTATRAAFETARRKGQFAKGLKRAVSVPETLAATIEALLERAALDGLSLANKAGLVAPGHSRVLDAIAEGGVSALVEADDGAPDGVRKIAAALRRAGATAPVVGCFTSEQLGLALGRANVIHAALGTGPAAAGFLDRVAALGLWREGGLAGEAPASAPAPHADDEPITNDTRPATDGTLDTLDHGRGNPQDLARND